MGNRPGSFVLAAVVATYSAAGQQRHSPFSLRTGIDLVLVPVTLMDRRGASIGDLDQRHFTVFQDNSPQAIVSFSKENAPCTLAVVLDASESMLSHFSLAKLVAEGVLDGSEAGDEASLVSVSDQPTVDSPITSSTPSIQALLPFIKPAGNTALVDTVSLALAQLRHAHNPRKAVLVVSDGMDNNSRLSKAELMRIAVEADAQIYTVSVGGAPRTAKPVEERQQQEGLAFLADLAAKTGGMNYSVEFPSEAHKVAVEIRRALRDQYLIGYTPTQKDASRKWHSIRVKLDDPKISVYARGGYYSR
jgi:Ca-activated chloride channel family protein